jgi:hypothetical protein
MDITRRRTIAEIEALLKILAECERQELTMLMLERQEAKYTGSLSLLKTRGI